MKFFNDRDDIKIEINLIKIKTFKKIILLITSKLLLINDERTNIALKFNTVYKFKRNYTLFKKI
jgi:hypothetical protein